MGLTIKPKKDCRWDLVSLGEVMVRLYPGDRRIHTARSFEVCEGGGEYNVARQRSTCSRVAVLRRIKGGRAGVVQWQYRSFPSFGRGFDSHRPLHTLHKSR